MDGIIITRNDEAKMKILKAYHGKEFEIKDLGHFYFIFLGLKLENQRRELLFTALHRVFLKKQERKVQNQLSLI